MTAPNQISPPELVTPEFTANPHEVYDRLRARFGAFAPVSIRGHEAMIVLDHHWAHAVLADQERFSAHPADPNQAARVCPGAARLRGRNDPDAGYGHDRALLGRVDQRVVRDTTITMAETLIAGFAGTGSAELVGQYALPLSCGVVGALLGVDGPQLDRAIDCVIAMRATHDDAAPAQGLLAAVAEAVAIRRERPGADVMSRLCAESRDDGAIARRIARIFHAAVEPTWNLLALILLRMASDPENGMVVGGSLSYRDAIDELLYDEPPLDLLLAYPHSGLVLGGAWLPADQPVAVSLAAANNDPAIRAGEFRPGNRGHLAWGAGERLCPASELALLILTNALERLLDAVPDITLTTARDQLPWRAGAGHRALAELPVRFTPMPSAAPIQ